MILNSFLPLYYIEMYESFQVQAEREREGNWNGGRAVSPDSVHEMKVRRV
jgi:hypothetical protein